MRAFDLSYDAPPIHALPGAMPSTEVFPSASRAECLDILAEPVSGERIIRVTAAHDRVTVAAMAGLIARVRGLAPDTIQNATVVAGAIARRLTERGLRGWVTISYFVHHDGLRIGAFSRSPGAVDLADFFEKPWSHTPYEERYDIDEGAPSPSTILALSDGIVISSHGDTMSLTALVFDEATSPLE